MGDKAQSLLTRKMKKYEDWETVLEKVQSKGNYLTHVAGVIDSTLLSNCMETTDLFEIIGKPGCPGYGHVYWKVSPIDFFHYKNIK